jgi:hypothetical protein
MACLIGEEVAIDFVDGHEDEVHAGIVGFLRDICHGVIKAVRNLKRHGCWSELSGSDSFALLIHVSYFGFCGDRDVTARPLRCQSPPAHEVTSVDSFGEGRLDGVVETCVVVICQLTL